jgi:hypothetical protein
MMIDDEYKALNAVHLDTVKELSQIVREQAKLLKQINETKHDANEKRHDTCCKYITISVITIALFTTIVLCCIFGQSNNQYLDGKCVPKIIKVQVEEK